MTSNASYREAYVWVWLPGQLEPVVAGRLARDGGNLLFNYGRSYLAHKDAISLYEPELPLQAGLLPLPAGLSMPNCLRDAAPDAWGRRVIINRRLGAKVGDAEPTDLDELTYLLESGSDRIGALDFQVSPSKYTPRLGAAASLAELLDATRLVEAGTPLTPELDAALLHGSSIGGARPKALIEDGDGKYIAKFSSQGDLYSVVKAEFIAMRLAALAGIDAAPVRMTQAAGKDVLLIGRFDRRRISPGWERFAMVSALTLLGLDEMMARYASYEELATIIRHRFTNPKATLRELFARLVFNILCGNTDDHARNHAAFWNGETLSLTPAYDICPQGRSGQEASQAMLIDGEKRFSQLRLCLDAAPNFLLPREEATAIAAAQIAVIRDHWDAVCDEAGLSAVDRQLFWRRQFLNPFAFKGAPEVLTDRLG
ncbi:type II toxin-antitoxin system HipA family toxin [Agrobacterium tumefaciens]|uniref:type II toxin-antitoxin system HipA family toxin n=1 Tax=Agrobacterium tumefaciens TaxID=358 RepID=UPI00224372C9|nr:HipA domain-containing protein [Agrobacterium tumefaciens]MCW8060445.1 type II toxin-antitoxin system HipA family toxin [Agrobacterium tumefaciens]MCW8145889.1 type II toxin-antitoxin system HipA family toxin [Agrobacterium tumefaciens]